MQGGSQACGYLLAACRYLEMGGGDWVLRFRLDRQT